MNTKYKLCFSTTPKSWYEKWESLRSFTRQWHNLDLAPVGRESELVKREESILKMQLPSSFQEWIRFSEELRQQNKFHDVLRDEYIIERLKEHKAISLMIQYEGDHFWAVREENLSQDDPPVDGYTLDYDSSEEKFDYVRQEAEHITSFVLYHMVFFIYGAGGNFVVNLDSVDDLLGEMQKTFEVQAKWGRLNIFENENIFALVCPNLYGATKYELLVRFWQKMSEDEIPDCILERIKRRS